MGFLNRSFKDKRVIKYISFAIDFVIVACSIIKYACAKKAVEQYYDEQEFNKKLREAYYISSIIMQCFQILMFFLTVLILYKIRSMLSQRPVCQTGLCGPSSSGNTTDAAEDKNTSSDGIEIADNRSLLSSEKEKKKDISEEICVLC